MAPRYPLYLVSLLLCASAVARIEAQTLTLSQITPTLADTNTVLCSNYSNWVPPCCQQLGGGGSLTTFNVGHSPLCSIPLTSQTTSFVDNASFNHHHIAHDYKIPGPDGTDCTSCSSAAAAPPAISTLPTLEIIRRHRYRDIPEELSSFGQGVFMNYDLHLVLYETTADLVEYSIDVFDPQNLQPWTLVDGGEFDTLDGIFLDSSDTIGEIRVFDASNTLTADPTQAVRAELRNHSGQLFVFDILQPVGYGDQQGRLTRSQDRNGYGITLTYKSWTQEEINQSPMRRFQLNTVSDAHGNTATFSYLSTQVSGRWVISRIELPGGVDLEYLYTDKLVQVTLPDLTTSTFSYTTNWDADADVISYADPAAGGVHRNKDVYFRRVGGTDPIFTSSELNVRVVVGGTGEVTYFSEPDVQAPQERRWVYEGTNKLKVVDVFGPRAPFFSSWQFSPMEGSNSFTGTEESTYDRSVGAGDRVYDATGR